jgi:O-methyltransferase involved in polyketide biosynthesis
METPGRTAGTKRHDWPGFLRTRGFVTKELLPDPESATARFWEDSEQMLVCTGDTSINRSRSLDKQFD